MPPFEVKSNTPSPQPYWKIAISTPYAAATDSRLRRIAFSAITIERNETRSKPKAKIRTNPNTIGALLLSSEF